MNKIPDFIYDIPMLDIKKGLSYCGDEEGYMDILSIFVSSIPEKADTLSRLFAEKDFKEYGILVHKLKSTSALVGATALSELAASLQKGVDTGEYDIIYEKNEEFLNMYLKLWEALKSVI